MQDTHLRFHSSNGKRLVLVVEDEIINREILSNIGMGVKSTPNESNCSA